MKVVSRRAAISSTGKRRRYRVEERHGGIHPEKNKRHVRWYAYAWRAWAGRASLWYRRQALNAVGFEGASQWPRPRWRALTSKS